MLGLRAETLQPEGMSVMGSFDRRNTRKMRRRRAQQQKKAAAARLAKQKAVERRGKKSGA